MDKVTIKSELVDPLSWPEVSEIEEYLEESLPDHQNDVDMMAIPNLRRSTTENFLNIFLKQQKIPLKEDFPLAGSRVDIKQESSFDASGGEEIFRTSIKEEGLDFIKTEESVDFGTLGHDVDVMAPPLRRSSRKKSGNLFLEQTNLPRNKQQKISLIKRENKLRKLIEDSSLEDIDIKEEPSFDATGEDEIHKIKREEDLDFIIKSEEFLSNENPNGNPFSSSKVEKNQVDSKLLSISDEDKSPTTMKLFSCSKCKFTTNRICTFVTHLRIHTVEPPFSCSQCNYRANQKSTIVTHLRIHTGEKPYSFSKYDYESYQKSTLVAHLIIHTGEKPFSCSECDFKTNKKDALMRHLRIHNNEKPFSCSQCDYKAHRKSDLVIHLRIHTGEKPFSCSQCDYKSNRKRYLVTHLKKHTGLNSSSC